MDRRSVLLWGAAGLITAACRQQGNEKSPTPGSEDKQAARLSEAQAREIVAAKKRYKIAVLFPFQGIPFWTNEAFGIFDQAEKAGVDLIWRSADGYENVDRQVQQLSEVKSLAVDAVLLGATNFAGTRAAVEDLVQSGIPVINHVTSTDSARVSSRVLVDYADIGRRQALYLKQALPNGGEVLMLNGPAGAEWSTNAVNGFKAELGAGSNLRIVAERNSNPDRVAAQRFVEDLIVRFPNAVACFSVTDSLAMGAVDALKGANKAGKVKVTTAGFSPETVEPIKQGLIHLNVDESPVLIGRAALNATVRVLNGDAIANEQFVPTPEHTLQSLQTTNLDQQWAPTSWKLP
jgi:ABC-type sugar transport system substrate-binding protein